MSQAQISSIVKKTAVVAAIAALAACATPEPPPPPSPPPPPPPVAEAIPYRPIPPGGASYTMTIPPLAPDGKRMTVNRNLGEHDTLWHFRSAWNVAALNCHGPVHQPIVDGYGAFIKLHDPALDVANAAIDQRYREQNGSRSEGVKAREAFMTQVYNYFALPPARTGFCSTALQIANESLASPPDDANAFAATNLQRLDAVFDRFFREYDRYRTASAEWDAKYGALYGSSQPGYVAVHGVPGINLASGIIDPAQQPVGQVLDPATGARIPLSAGTEESFATPVVQPLPEE